MRERRFHVMPNTIRNELYVIARIYRWYRNAPQKGLTSRQDLDDFLLAGGVLTARQLDTLAEDLVTTRKDQRRRSRDQTDRVVGEIRPGPADALDQEEEDEFIQAETVDRYAKAAKGFLAFALDAAKRGGAPAGDWNEIRTLREQLDAYFEFVISKIHLSIRIRPLSAEEEEDLIAESWVRTHEETLAGAEAVLRAFDTADPERLRIVRPFANQPSRYKPELA